MIKFLLSEINPAPFFSFPGCFCRNIAGTVHCKGNERGSLWMCARRGDDEECSEGYIGVC